MGSFLRQPLLLRGLAVALLAIAGLSFLHHQAEHFGNAGGCPVCLQGPVTALSSDGVNLVVTLDLEPVNPSAPDVLRFDSLILPFASRAPPASIA